MDSHVQNLPSLDHAGTPDITKYKCGGRSSSRSKNLADDIRKTNGRPNLKFTARLQAMTTKCGNDTQSTLLNATTNVVGDFSNYLSVSTLKITCQQSCKQSTCKCQVENLRNFYSMFMIPNIPCIIERKLTDDWKSVQKWVNCDGTPNISYLTHQFGTADVPVADCNVRYYNSQQKCTMKFKDYITYWEKLTLDGYDFATHGNLYLKDWHFTKDFPDYCAYKTPPLFYSDWLNEFWSSRNDINDDYRFVYMGPKGSWTPLHVDVYHSYSWSANVCGKKLWILFPPEEEDNLKDSRGNMPFDILSSEMNDCTKYPKYLNVERQYRVVQEHGQIIFVPSGWIHQVHNLEDTISINHNWFNGCNIHIIWAALLVAYRNVEKEIMDCRDMEDWEEQCQRITRSTHGMDVKEFWTLLETIAESKLKTLITIRYQRNTEDNTCQLEKSTVDDRLSQNCDETTEEPNSTRTWKEALVLFELSKIRTILDNIINDDSTKNLLPFSKLLQLRQSIHLTICIPDLKDLPL